MGCCSALSVALSSLVTYGRRVARRWRELGCNRRTQLLGDSSPGSQLITSHRVSVEAPLKPETETVVCVQPENSGNMGAVGSAIARITSSLLPTDKHHPSGCEQPLAYDATSEGSEEAKSVPTDGVDDAVPYSTTLLLGRRDTVAMSEMRRLYSHPFARGLSKGEIELCNTFAEALDVDGASMPSHHRGFISLGTWALASGRLVVPLLRSPTVNTTRVVCSDRVGRDMRARLDSAALRLYGDGVKGNKCAVYFSNEQLTVLGRGAYDVIDMVGVSPSDFLVTNCNISSELVFVTLKLGDPDKMSQILCVTTELVGLIADVARDNGHFAVQESGFRAGLSIKPSATRRASVKLGVKGGILFTGSPMAIYSSVAAFSEVIKTVMEVLNYSDLCLACEVKS